MVLVNGSVLCLVGGKEGVGGDQNCEVVQSYRKCFLFAKISGNSHATKARKNSSEAPQKLPKKVANFEKSIVPLSEIYFIAGHV